MRNKVLLDISHPNINKIKDTFKDDNNIGFILELAKGVSLSELLHSFHRVPSEIVKVIVCQLVSIFEYLHNNNYVYKDLKASHVFLHKSGIITLIDLGMVEKLEDGERSLIPAGTFHSMAPEMIDLWESSTKNDGIIDATLPGYNSNIDLFSIGILIHELLIGKPPFGYLQANTTKEERLSYFEKTRESIDFDKFRENLSDKLDRDTNKTEDDLVDLMKCLLEQKESDRLGANKDFDSLKSHNLFSDFDWNIEEKTVKDYFKTHKSTNKIKDIFDFIET
jgi:cGMP-dependent protein kinase 1